MIKAVENNNIRGEWSRELNVEFIADYKNLKVIWDPSMRHLKSDRVQAVRNLCEKYKLSPEEVRGRIKVLRTSFHREHMKVLKSANSDEIYVPKWYGYELMRFVVDDIVKDHHRKIKNEIEDSFHISDSTIFDINFLNYEQLKKEGDEQNNVQNESLENEIPKMCESNMNNRIEKNIFKSPEQTNNREDIMKRLEDKPEEITIRCDNIQFKTKDSIEAINENLDTLINHNSDTDSNLETQPPLKRTKICKPNDIWEKDFSSRLTSSYHCHCSCSNKEKDELSVFGESVGLTLKNLKNDKSKIIAKHMINNILFEAQMGKYDQ